MFKSARKVVRSSAILGAVLAVCSGGCGDSSPSGVSGSRKLSELSDAELNSVCAWMVPTVAQITCNRTGGGSGEGRVIDTGDDTGDTAASAPSQPAVDVAGSSAMGRDWTIAECKDEFRQESGGCEGTVKNLETCVAARQLRPCEDPSSLAACEFMKACPIGSGNGSEWDSCYFSGTAELNGGCALEWRCPDGTDRKLTCMGSYHDDGEYGYSCTCRDLKEGLDEGTFTDSDLCSLQSHNAAYRANKGCGWNLPEM